MQKQLNYHIDSKSDFVDINFWQKMFGDDPTEEFPCIVHDFWTTDVDVKEFPKKVLEASFLSVFKLYNSKAYFYLHAGFEGMHVLLSMNNSKQLNINVACDAIDKGKEFHAKLREIFPVTKYAVDDKKEINLKFWFNGARGPSFTTRDIDIPSWEDIFDNYPPAVAHHIGELVNLTPDKVNGKLLLWHGPPGTGKTYAIRSLAYEWRNWCSFEYITDPEAFLGDPNYMMQVCLNDSPLGNNLPGEAYYEEGDEDEPEITAIPRWKVLILEDAGELIQLDSHERKGQAVSRLLNIVDGLIGQGLRLMILITTNEPVDSLSKAASRAGRCLSKLEYPQLTSEQANAWLKAKGSPTTVTGLVGIADLYAKLADPDYSPVPIKKKVGFGN